MATIKTQIFHYGAPFNGALEDVKGRYSPSETLTDGTAFNPCSSYSITGAAPATSLPVLRAAQMYARIMESSWKGAGIGTTANGAAVSELLLTGTSVAPEKVRVTVVTGATGGVVSSDIDVPTGTISEITLGDRAEGGEGIFLALFPRLMQDEEFRDCYEHMAAGLILDEESMTEAEWETTSGLKVKDFGLYLARMSDNLYQRTNHEVANKIPLSMNASGKPRIIRQQQLKDGNYKPVTGVYGAFYALMSSGRSATTSAAAMTMDEMREKYSLGISYPSEEQRKRVPHLDSAKFTVDEVTRGMVRMIYMTMNMAVKINNGMLIGDAGTGKTTMTTMIADILGLAKTVVTGHVGTEIFDLLWVVMPNDGTCGNKVGVMDILRDYDLPTTEEIAIDLPGSYRKIYGEEMPAGYTAEECIQALFQRVVDIQRQLLANQKDYTLQIGPLLMGLANEELVEFQEVCSISNPGVLVGLNGLIEPNGSVMLPNGKVITRSPHSVLFFTTNGTNYAGNIDLQGSVKSRMAFIHKIPNPPVARMAENAMRQTGFTNRSMAEAMADYIDKLARVLKDKKARDICCGPRELMYWMTAVLVDGEDSVYRHATEFVINKAARDEEEEVEFKDILDATSLAV